MRTRYRYTVAKPLTEKKTGRANQRARTRDGIVEACRDLIRAGAMVTMPEVATRARVSEATAYRYFPDLATLLSEADEGLWPAPADALAAVAGSTDPVERVSFATELLLRRILRYQGAVRAMIAATTTRPARTSARPGHRFELIDEALAPLATAPGASGNLIRLKNELAVVASAEALFILTDLCGLEAEEAIATAVSAAATLTRAALVDGIDLEDRHRSSTRSPRGCEQQISALPSAGSSTGSGA